jgi:hypothetical protein
MSKTPTSDTQTTKPRSPRRSARESLIRLVTDYAPVVPFFAALLAAQPEPKVTPPPAAAPPPSDDVSVAPSSLSRPEGCAAELRARRALEILVPDAASLYIDRAGLAHNAEDLEPGLRREVEEAFARARAAAVGTSR